MQISIDMAKEIAGKYSMPYLNAERDDWIDSEGTLWRINEMNTEHLVYCLRTLRRNDEDKFLFSYDTFTKRELQKRCDNSEITDDMVLYVYNATKELIKDKISRIEKEIKSRAEDS